MICGAEACKLGAMIHGAELRVHFLKSFQKGSTCENLSQKGLKSKKVATNNSNILHTSRTRKASSSVLGKRPALSNPPAQSFFQPPPSSLPSSPQAPGHDQPDLELLPAIGSTASQHQRYGATVRA
jgi:hypothetical protein